MTELIKAKKLYDQIINITEVISNMTKILDRVIKKDSKVNVISAQKMMLT